MYRVIGSAVAVGAVSILLINKYNLKTIDGKEIELEAKPLKPKSNFIGGILFGIGSALTGACPGPLYGHVGYGHTIMIVSILCAIIGVFMYGVLKDKLLH